MKKQWTHKVVKCMRGCDGQWFDFPTADTFCTLEAAVAYAKSFAASQREGRVAGARIEVRSRRKIDGSYVVHTEHV